MKCKTCGIEIETLEYCVYCKYVCFVKPIYIYDEKSKKKNKEEMIELKEIRLISHIFPESVDLEKLKNEFESVLGFMKK